MSVQERPFGSGGRLFEIDAGGIRAAVADFGAALVSLRHPDGTELVLSYDDVQGYQTDGQSVGVIPGRYANRIAGGAFTLDGATWTLPRNNGDNHLHGGPGGFGRQFWKAETDPAANAVRFLLTSPHLDQGYPGTVEARAEYRLTDDGTLVLTLSATADRPTVVNMTQHAYFNLAGGGDITGHHLLLHAGHYLPVDEGLIPTGELRGVADTAFDYRTPRPFDPALDTPFQVDGAAGDLRPVARVEDPVSGRCLQVRATMPGVQIYGGGGLAKGGRFPAHGGFCIEPQYHPNAPNQAGFMAPRVDPETPYAETVVYAFA